MPDLSVFDVQKALRDHIALGHDVTQRPQHVHVDGKPYQMRVGANLTIDNKNRFSILNSYLTQSERPVVSNLSSLAREGSQEGSRRVAAQAFHPLIFTNADKSTEHHYLAGLPHPYYDLSDSSYDDIRDNLRLKFNDYVKTPSPYDVHQILSNHVHHPLDYVGTEYDAMDNPRGVKTLKDFSTPFRVEEALKNVINYGEPYSGLIHVRNTLPLPQSGPHLHQKYFYNPETEELHRYQ